MSDYRFEIDNIEAELDLLLDKTVEQELDQIARQGKYNQRMNEKVSFHKCSLVAIQKCHTMYFEVFDYEHICNDLTCCLVKLSIEVAEAIGLEELEQNE